MIFLGLHNVTLLHRKCIESITVTLTLC